MWSRKTVAVVIIDLENNSILDVVHDFDSTGLVDEIIVVCEKQARIDKDQNRTRAKYIRQKQSGLGSAIKEGISKTKADLIIVTEGNRSFKSKDIVKLLSYSDDFKVVFGSRTHIPLIHKGSGMTFTRRLIDDLFGKLISILFLSQPLTDVGCTLRLTNRTAWEKVRRECKSKNEIFLTEWLLSTVKNKVNFIEIPVHFDAPKKQVKKRTYFYYSTRAIQIIFYIFKFWFR